MKYSIVLSIILITLAVLFSSCADFFTPGDIAGGLSNSMRLPPVVTITSPLSNTTSHVNFKASGTAFDRVGVAAVYTAFSLTTNTNTPVFTQAQGTTNWSYEADVFPGNYTLQVFASNHLGLVSATNTLPVRLTNLSNGVITVVLRVPVSQIPKDLVNNITNDIILVSENNFFLAESPFTFIPQNSHQYSAVLKKDTNDTQFQYYKIKIRNPFTTHTFFQNSYLNTTPGFTSSTANEVINDSAFSLWWTSMINTSGDMVITQTMNKWAGTGPTFPLTNISVTLIIKNIPTNGIYTNSNMQNIAITGNDPGLNPFGFTWQAALDNNVFFPVEIYHFTSNTVSIIVNIDYTGVASFTYKTAMRVLSTNGYNWQWETGYNHSFSLHKNESVVTQYVYFQGF